jgi:SAM-dependent methyltransferase
MDSADWDARYAATDLVWGSAANRFVVERFKSLQPGKVLDLAAGEGRNAIWLAERGWRVTAVDFSAVAARRGRQLAAERGLTIDWVVADLRDYCPVEAGFDAVLIAYLHLPSAELAPILRKAASAVAPGGRIIVVGHDLTNLVGGTGGPQDPTVLYTPETITAELPGLVVELAERVTRPIPTPGGGASAVDTLVQAVRDSAA